MFASLHARTRDLFRRYGRVAVGCHFAVYFTGWGGCYLAINRGFNVDAALRDWGLLSPPKQEADAAGDAAAPPSTVARWLAGGGPLALSFVANKALFPVRAPITLALTPAVARALRVRAAAGGAGAGRARDA